MTTNTEAIRAALGRVTQLLKDGDTLGASLAIGDVERLVDAIAQAEQRHGHALAMRVLQSDLYAKLDDLERSECDALIAATQPESPKQPHQQGDTHHWPQQGGMTWPQQHAPGQCRHASSGCNYPEGECSGACLPAILQRQNPL